MYKLVLSFLFFSFIMTLVTGIGVNANSGFYTASLMIDMDDTQTTAYVDNASDWPNYGTVQIDGEYMTYYDIEHDVTYGYILTGIIRGDENTTPTKHYYGASVYSEAAAQMNDSMGFNIVTIDSNFSLISMPIWIANFAFHVLPNALTMNFDFVKSGPMQLFRIAFVCFSASFMFVIGMMVFSTISSMVPSSFKLRGA